MFSLEKRNALIHLMRLDRPYGTLLLLFPTLWSLVIAASGRPTLTHLMVFILGSFFMRSAGCVINDMTDYKFDAQVARTKDRPIASGVLTHKEAFFVLIPLLTVSFLLVLLLNTRTILFSFIALFVASFYPFAKRLTHFPQAVLGIAFSFGILMAWTAVLNEITLIPILIFIANLFWTIGYDTIYALMDKEDDLKIGVKSTAIFFGSKSTIAIGFCFLNVVLLLYLVGQQAKMGAPYYEALMIAAIGLLYQTVLLLSAFRSGRSAERERLFSLFKAHVFIGAIILAGIVFNY
ncbi:MAG: 4-hydroxybenzoate octaprenyltransferase [Nitrospirota bacterium]